jgi:hypothetical protein
VRLVFGRRLNGVKMAKGPALLVDAEPSERSFQ